MLRHHLAATDALLDIYEAIMARAPSTDYACRLILFVLVLTQLRQMIAKIRSLALQHVNIIAIV